MFLDNMVIQGLEVTIDLSLIKAANNPETSNYGQTLPESKKTMSFKLYLF